MEQKIKITKTIETEIYFSTEEIEQQILLQAGMTNATIEWCEKSYGGIDGCFIRQIKTIEE